MPLTTRQQMSSLGAGDALGTVTLPKLRSIPIPARVAKAYPEFQEWQRQQQAAMDQWTQDATAVLRKLSGQ